ncbi:MAG TPA: flagellar biosynthesis protein FlhB [Noviherbaspirillum sp.]|nr:flagellar biosynthesis protein FlhB [Noviherbaspirillum sp.]
MADQDSERSEEATPYKLEQARKQGSVAKSADFTALAVLAALVGIVYANGWDAFRQSARLQQAILARVGNLDWRADGVVAWLAEILTDVLNILAPLFLALFVVAVLINLFQTGPIFSVKPLTPDLSRLNPATGFKRVFSMRTLYEAVKSIIKLVILGTVAYSAIRDDIAGLVLLSAIDTKAYAKILLGITGSLLVKLVLTSLVIAAIDYSYTKWEFSKRMRMSRRDVRDEVKQREGDPRVRSRIRELRMEMLKRSKAMRSLPSADVLITNPTHLAVALRYQHGEAAAPQLVAKGAGELARKMRMTAARHNIPVVQNRMLARTLFREVDYEGFVPEKLYPQLAKIMVWVYAMREAKRAGGGVA